MIIRLINEKDDRAAISRVYEESWKSAYKNIIPQDYLESIKKGHWVKSLDRGIWKTLIVLEGDHIVGTSSYCESRFPEMKGYGEIVSIYLLPEYMGKGYGKALLCEAVKNLAKEGYTKIFLWVLEENVHARAFYERMGFQKQEVCLNDNIGGKDLREVQYIYDLEDKDHEKFFE